MERKPRILFITPLPPPVHGSSMVSQWIKGSEILNKEFKMDFVNLSTSRKVEEIQKASLRLYFIKFWRFLWNFICVFFKLCEHRYDLCYLAITCHGKPFLKDFPFVILCKLFGRRIVIHQHNKGMSEDVDHWPYKWLLPLAYKGTKVILLSEHLYTDIERIVERDQILICPNGIPEQEETQERKKRKADLPHILFLSNLIESKGVFVLLNACKLLKDRGHHFICDFVGGTTKEINAERFEAVTKKLNIDDRIFYHGPKYGEEKEEYWKMASFFVFPTFYKDECFPLVLLEAMQHSMPVVTTNEGGIPDIIIDGSTGFICKTKDPLSLANAIEKLLTDSSTTQVMGKNGYHRYKELFTQANFEYSLRDCLKKAF